MAEEVRAESADLVARVAWELGTLRTKAGKASRLAQARVLTQLAEAQDPEPTRSVHTKVIALLRAGLDMLGSPPHAEAIAELLWIDRVDRSHDAGSRMHGPVPQVGERRQTASKWLGITVETLRRHWERDLLHDLAQSIVRFAESPALTEERPDDSARLATQLLEPGEQPPNTSVSRAMPHIDDISDWRVNYSSLALIVDDFLDANEDAQLFFLALPLPSLILIPHAITALLNRVQQGQEIEILLPGVDVWSRPYFHDYSSSIYANRLELIAENLSRVHPLLKEGVTIKVSDDLPDVTVIIAYGSFGSRTVAYLPTPPPYLTPVAWPLLITKSMVVVEPIERLYYNGDTITSDGILWETADPLTPADLQKLVDHAANRVKAWRGGVVSINGRVV